MANALKFYGDPKTSETEKFCRTFDKWFDCLNVRNKSEYIRKKSNLKPYIDPEDERLKVCWCIITCVYIELCVLQLQWLSEDFLSYLNEWEESVEAREDVDDAEKAVMLLSAQTSYGLKMTGILNNYPLL